MSEIKHIKEVFENKIKSIEKAVKVAHKEMNRRLDGMNEFRNQLDKQAAEFITRKELITVLVALIAFVALLIGVFKVLNQ